MPYVLQATLAVTVRAIIYSKCWFHYNTIINLSSLYMTNYDRDNIFHNLLLSVEPCG